MRTKRTRLLLTPIAFAVLLPCPGITAQRATSALTGTLLEVPKVLPIRDRPAVVDAWLRERLDTVLPEVMRREGFDMWIVDNREYNEDPVFFSLMPAATMAARRRTILVFYDPGQGHPVERFAVSRYGIGDFYEGIWSPEEEPDQYAALAKLVQEKDPRRIGVNISDTFAFGDGLTVASWRNMERVLPREYLDRVQGAERLAVGWLEKRTLSETEAYEGICRLIHDIIARGFSKAVIHPGITRTEDVVWWFRQTFADLDLGTWFQPSVEILRQGGIDPSDPDGDVIHHGDVLHCDVGITYLGLNTDTQQMAYVLRPGEEEPPAGLVRALANSNRVQEILMEEFVEGRTGNQILATALARCRQEGLTASIYTHPLGFHGHGAGPTIGLWDRQDGVPGKGDYPLFAGTVHSIELNCATAVPEWNGERITIGLEQDAVFDGTVARFLDHRQTRFHLVR